MIIIIAIKSLMPMLLLAPASTAYDCGQTQCTCYVTFQSQHAHLLQAEPLL